MIRTSLLHGAILGAVGLVSFESACLSQVEFAAAAPADERPSADAPEPRGAPGAKTPRWRPVRRNQGLIEMASAEIEKIPAPEGIRMTPGRPGEAFERIPPEAVSADIESMFDFGGYGAGCEGDTCDYMGSGVYGSGAGYFGPGFGPDHYHCGPLCGLYTWIQTRPWGYWLRNFQVFGGIHGFKGPFDLGRNGNFGFHEGINFGAPLGDPWGVGYQLGVQGVHSNFSGDHVWEVREGDRNQVFFTGGLFRRARRQGWQWGVVFDLLRDSYYEKATLGQIRSETTWVTGYGWDIGYWGAYGTKEDENSFHADDSLIRQMIKINDLFAFFYRKHFSGGGEGRLWAGFTGQSGALFGGDIRIPIGTSWALENDIQYHLPKEGKGEDGLHQEAWSVNINLVWYPGRRADQVRGDPFRPLFGVANNGTFMEDVDLR